MEAKKLTIPQLQKMKADAEKITMLTAYDYPTAALVDRSGMEMILVGDSLGNTVLGLPDTVAVTLEDMLHHTRAVKRGVKRALIVADMPFMSFNISIPETIRNAGRLIKEAGADAVKLEGGTAVLKTVEALTQAGISVMGHLGLTPQTAGRLGGYTVQGRDLEAAKKMIEEARGLEQVGAFSLVLECVPEGLAKTIAQSLRIPVIGIGAGPHCDGQVLVFHDLAGLLEGFRPKFVKQYLNLAGEISQALENYREDVRQGKFPADVHGFK